MFRKLFGITAHFPLMTRFVILIIVPLVVAAGCLVVRFKSDLPQDRIVLSGTNLTAPVSIVRDGLGVPRIEAKTDIDAFYAIGYVHAQDRLWQLELQRRMVQGRLSEIFGKDSVTQDTWFRTLGLYDAAKTAWPALSHDAQASLTAYAAGIKAGIAARHGLPVEFRILNIEPEPWTEIDSLAWMKMFAFSLGGNFQREISKYLLGKNLNEDQIKAFFPFDPSNIAAAEAHTEATANDAVGLMDMLTFQKDFQTRVGMDGRSVGSNMWVVSGKLTEHGEAILANDPHLDLQIPSLWYAISAKGKDLDVAGMGLVGLPVVMLGHNSSIAWGGTSMMADTQDLYLERPDGGRAGSYVVNDHTEPFIARTEEIRIRADFPEQLHKNYLPLKIRIRSTRHGPIISDQMPMFDQPVSLRWTALDAGDSSYEAFYRLNYARDWGMFNDALRQLVAPALNMVYADRAGNIGYLGAGRIPIRKSGDGTQPSQGWNDEGEWKGYIPSSSWPQSYNPESGYIINANNRMAGADYPYFISQDWASPARAQRIEQLLRDKLDRRLLLSMEDMQRIQGDTVDVDAQAIMAQLKDFAPSTDDEKIAWNYLKTWNGDMAPDSQAASIFHTWMRHFRIKLFEPVMVGVATSQEQSKYVDEVERDVQLHTLVTILQRRDSLWCGELESAMHPSCEKLLHTSLQSAIAELYKLKGDRSMGSWQWGGLQRAIYRHTPFSDFKPLDRLFEARISSGGSENTINLAESHYSENEGYLQHLGASFRQLISVNRDGITDRFMMSTGQSGDVLSTHYSDMVKPFHEQQYALLWNTPKVEISKKDSEK